MLIDMAQPYHNSQRYNRSEELSFGILGRYATLTKNWIPAFAGMTASFYLVPVGG
jgi:hypothetical protein